MEFVAEALKAEWKVLVIAVVVTPTFVWLRTKTSRFINDFIAMPGTVADIGTRVANLEKQVGSNEGSSLHDNIKKIKGVMSSLVEKERAIVDASKIAMWHSDGNGDCIWASSELLELVGYTFAEGFKGRNWINLYFTDDQDEIIRRWNQSIESKSAFVMKTRYRHSSGSAVPVFLEARYLADGGFVGTARDLRREERTMNAINDIVQVHG